MEKWFDNKKDKYRKRKHNQKHYFDENFASFKLKNKKKRQALIWIFVWALITIIPFFTWKYFGFIWIIFPIAGFILIKLIIDYFKGKYN